MENHATDSAKFTGLERVKDQSTQSLEFSVVKVKF